MSSHARIASRRRATLPFLAAALVAAALVPAPAPLGAQGPYDSVAWGDELPIVLVPPAPNAAPMPRGRTLAVVLSGDGGWASLVRTIAGDLAARGVGVIGIDSRAYLRRRRTPDETAQAIVGAIRRQQHAWGATRVILVGYSRGADLAPFVATRMPADMRAQLDLVAMLGLATYANFQFHLIDLVRDTRRPDDVPTIPEIVRLTGQPRAPRLLCIYGQDEAESGCRELPAGTVDVVPRGGAHHFDGDFHALATLILDAIPR